jgi:ABC-type branched-subunit amino acid transport system substrate-binding protein
MTQPSATLPSSPHRAVPAPGPGGSGFGSVRARAAAAVLALVAGTLSTSACTEPEPVPVLAVVTSTSMLEAAAMGIEAGLAAHPGLALDTLFRIEATPTAEPSLAAAREVVQVPGILAVIGHANSSGTLASAAVYREAGIVQISPTASSPLLSGIAPRFFRMIPSDEAQSILLVDLLEEAVGGKGSLAVLWVNDEYGRGLREALIQEVEGRPDLQVSLDLPHAESGPGILDAEETTEFLVAAGVDGVAFLGRAQSVHRLLPELRSRMGALPLVGSDGVGLAAGGVDGLEDAGWEGVVFVQLAPTSGTPELDRFARRFLSETGRTRVTSGEVLAHDAARLLVEGVARGARTPETLAEWLGQLAGEPAVVEGLLAGAPRFDALGDGPERYRAARIGPGGVSTMLPLPPTPEGVNPR